MSSKEKSEDQLKRTGSKRSFSDTDIHSEASRRDQNQNAAVAECISKIDNITVGSNVSGDGGGSNDNSDGCSNSKRARNC